MCWRNACLKTNLSWWNGGSEKLVGVAHGGFTQTFQVGKIPGHSGNIYLILQQD